MKFLRAQFWTQPMYFEGILGCFLRLLKSCKSLSDAGLEVVPGDGIEPPTRGFSVRWTKTCKSFNCLPYKYVVFSPTLDIVG